MNHRNQMSKKKNPSKHSLFDGEHIWHPYSSPFSIDKPNHQVLFAKGIYLEIAGYGKVMDAMSSWWCMIHGYNHKKLNAAIKKQLSYFSHVMFGGLTHQPAISLVKKLIAINTNQITNKPYFQSVFLADSGSISVEVAIKMSLQAQILKSQQNKNKIMTVRGGYHGDSLAAMSVCDPKKGMHQLFNHLIPKQIFAPRPPLSDIHSSLNQDYLKTLKKVFAKNHQQTAAFIIEPIVQGAGGMRFYSKDLLQEIRLLCNQYDIFLIFDEIATGFGRTGKLFAYQHAGVIPDILCLGKALSGGYLNIAAVMAKKKIAKLFQKKHSPLMHGPTFMANPLACAVSLASIKLLLRSNWQEKIKRIENIICFHFFQSDLKNHPIVKKVRVLGAIGVIEIKDAFLGKEIQKKLLHKGVWIRPFGELIYIMPPYCITKSELDYLCSSISEVIKSL